MGFNHCRNQMLPTPFVSPMGVNHGILSPFRVVVSNLQFFYARPVLLYLLSYPGWHSIHLGCPVLNRPGEQERLRLH